MTPVWFYRLATMLPFAVTLLLRSAVPIWSKAHPPASGALAQEVAPTDSRSGGAVTIQSSAVTLQRLPQSPTDRMYGYASMYLVFTGAILIPYSLFLVIVAAWFRPRTERQHRLTALAAPILIAVPLILFYSALFGATRGAGWIAGVTLGVGYCYVVIIEVTLAVAKRAGFVKRDAPVESVAV